ncbi:MAG: MBL fold metallo-hydrolase [Bacteroidales bacterium]|nr:MBL fold metallo-hydrolase [Bacteroidales bacterium]
MRKLSLLFLFSMFSSHYTLNAQYQQDTIPTTKGDLIITFLGHGTLYFTYNDQVIHIDPVDRYADYSGLPKADYIFITHHHGDHFQAETIDFLRKETTAIKLTATCAESYSGTADILTNGDVFSAKATGSGKMNENLFIAEAVPAFNIVHERSAGQPFHPRGEGNGYVFTFGDTRVYVAGDTEDFPEMKEITGIDIAFLPMNLPYTMSPEMVVNAVRMLKPKVLYPYHYGNTDINELVELMKDVGYCELRVRNMK